MKFNRLSLLIAFALSSNLVFAHDSQEFQLLIAFDQTSLTTYAANIGGSIVYSFLDPVPFGGAIIINSLILPKDTVNVKHQNSYLVDKHGDTITSNDSIGTFRAQEFMLTDTISPNEVFGQVIIG